jgi:predicted SnoaL-like aldol condensation-catalyzing enzyme
MLGGDEIAVKAAVVRANFADFDVIDIVRVRGGRIVEHWNVVDPLSLLRQLRVVPVPAQA